MIHVHCERCKRLLEEPGGLLFGPPDDLDRCEKDHLCMSCTVVVKRFVRGERIEREAP